MDGFTLIDGVVAAVILLSALLAYARGFLREAFAIVGWIVAAILAFVFAPAVVPLVQEIPYLGDMLTGSCELSVITGFGIIFAVALAVVSLFTPLFSTAVRNSALGGIDQGLGFIFGVIRGILLVAIAFFVYFTVLTPQDVPMVDNSRSAVIFGNMSKKIASDDPERLLHWVTGKYEELAGTCQATTGDGSAF